MLVSKEIWKDINGYEGIYQVSNHGRVKSLARKVFRKSSIMNLKEKILKQANHNSGYKIVALFKDGKHKMILVHRLVGEAFIPNPENKTDINHKNGIKSDNSINNLEWLTRSENIKHAHLIGLKDSVRGRKHYRAKLNESQVLIIRKIYSNKQHTQKELGEMYNVSRATIQGIVTNRYWKHI